VILTVEGSVTTGSLKNLQPLTEIRDNYRCALRFTVYVNAKNNTDCELVDALMTGQHEIAVSSANNSRASIEASRDYLVNVCKVPEVYGYRAPLLVYNNDTLDDLHDLGFLYDSSVATTDHILSNYGREHFWPYTYNGNLDPRVTCACDANTTLPGLWEVPVWRWYSADDEPLLSVDIADPVSLQENFARRHSGNRAPFGIHVRSGWLNANVFPLKQWIEDVLDAYSDVHFVTTSELLEWMKTPVPKGRYRQWCEGQESKCFTPIPIDCVFGTYNKDTCNCDCLPNYCQDAAGICRRSTGCDDVDGGWSDWNRDYPCCEEKRLLTRTCTNPSQSGAGADCEGSELEVENCFPNDCPNNGFSEWGEFSPCCLGNRTQTRECLAAPSINNGVGCIGPLTNTEICGPDVCERAYWPDFSRGACVFAPFPPRGQSNPSNTFQDCCRAHFDFDLGGCYEKSENPLVDGGWSEWSPTGPCCDGKQSMSRTCSNPAPANGGRSCEGTSSLVQDCAGGLCENGGWSEWSDFQPCCHGQRRRTRDCLAADTTFCEGFAMDSEPCDVEECSKAYGPDYARSICRIVDIDPDLATDSTQEATYTSAEACCREVFSWNSDCSSVDGSAINGGWNEWTEFSKCCKGIQSRYRACVQPRPANGGADCVGDPVETRSCLEDECQVKSSACTVFSDLIWLCAAILSFVVA